jgi:hypothetical protein
MVEAKKKILIVEGDLYVVDMLAEQDTLTNPVSGLPDGRLVDERILEYLSKPSWSMLIVSLENLDIFR